MRNSILCALTLILSLFDFAAFACGGGFGQEVTIDPTQKIVISYHSGEESYIFKPHFCGRAADFGLILPVPNALTKNPTLTDTNLVDQLEAIAAPRVETVEVCSSGGLLGSGSKGASGGAAPDQLARSNDGVDVISQGQVGDFQWQLLKADSAQNFTDWLDANQFPYPASAQAAFDHYVQAGWYFVAFSVAASDTAPPAGYRLCGDFGPIQLSFQSSPAVIPARIATAGDTQSTFYWRLFTVSSYEMMASASPNSAQATQTLQFAGALSADDISQQSSIAKLAKAGDWLTELDLSFYAPTLSQDIWVDPSPSNSPYRRTIYVEKEVDCGVFGCSIKGHLGRKDWGFAGAFAAMGVALAVVGRRWRYRSHTHSKRASRG